MPWQASYPLNSLSNLRLKDCKFIFALYKTSFFKNPQPFGNRNELILISALYFLSEAFTASQSFIVVTTQTRPCFMKCGEDRRLSPYPCGTLIRTAVVGRNVEGTRWRVIISIMKPRQHGHRRMSNGACGQGVGDMERGAATPRGSCRLRQALEPSPCTAGQTTGSSECCRMISLTVEWRTDS